VKEPCGGSGARKVGTGRVPDEAGAGEAVVAVELHAVAAADTAFKSRSSAFTPGSRKLAAITFVVGGGLGRRLDRRVPVGSQHSTQIFLRYKIPTNIYVLENMHV
jgi:hypothetical protein